MKFGKKSMCVVLLVVFLIFSVVPVSAFSSGGTTANPEESIFNFEADLNNHFISVTVDLPEEKNNEVSFILMSPDYYNTSAAKDASDWTSYLEEVAYLDQITLSDAGKADIKVQLDAIEGGKYTAFVGTTSGSHVAYFEASQPTDPTPVIYFKENSGINGDEGTEFNLTVLMNAYPDFETRSIEGIIELPEGVEVSAVDAKTSCVIADSFDSHVKDNLLRFTFINTATSDALTYTGDGASVLLTLNLKLTADKNMDDILKFAFKRFTLKSLGEAYEYTVTDAVANVPVTSVGDERTATAQVLYESTGLDVIPEGLTAVSVTFTGVQPVQEVAFGDMLLYYSPQRSEIDGTVVYVGLVDSTVTLDSLNNIENYSFGEPDPLAPKVVFGDVNKDDLFNAQDALATLSLWLRKDLQLDADKLLAANVNADGVINTSDAIGIVDYVISQKVFPVVVK